MKTWPGTHGPETQEVMNKLFPTPRKRMTKLQKARTEVFRLWTLMCEEESVPTDSRFVVFTSTNKYSAEYTKAVTVFLDLQKAAR